MPDKHLKRIQKKSGHGVSRRNEQGAPQRDPQKPAMPLSQLEPMNGMARLLRQVQLAPASISPAEAALLQRSIGNRAVGRLSARQVGHGIRVEPGHATAPLRRILNHNTRIVDEAKGSSRPLIQAKFTLGPAGDRYEQEAEHAAAQIAGAPTNRESIQRQELVGADGDQIAPELEHSIQTARSGGQPLGREVRKSMETSFGADFKGVNVHTDARSDLLNRSLHARAFTTGQDIFFCQGEYQPQSASGKKLVAHELTHTIQQQGGQVHRHLIQRDIGFEFEVPSSITRRAVPPLTQKEKSGERALPVSRGNIADRVYNRRFGRQANVGKLHPLHKFTKILQGDHFTLESDDSNAGGTNMEFVTSQIGLSLAARPQMQEMPSLI